MRMEPMTIRASDYVLDDLNSEGRGQHHTAFFTRSRPEPEPEADAPPRRPYEDAHWHEEAGYLFGVPASGKAMKALHVPAPGQTRELGCAVCLDDFEGADKLRTMPCSHSFHQRCIFRWLRVSRVCPYCRFPLPSVDEQRVLDEQASGAQAGLGNNCPTGN